MQKFVLQGAGLFRVLLRRVKITYRMKLVTRYKNADTKGQ